MKRFVTFDRSWFFDEFVDGVDRHYEGTTTLIKGFKISTKQRAVQCRIYRRQDGVVFSELRAILQTPTYSTFGEDTDTINRLTTLKAERRSEGRWELVNIEQLRVDEYHIGALLLTFQRDETPTEFGDLRSIGITSETQEANIRRDLALESKEWVKRKRLEMLKRRLGRTPSQRDKTAA
jgi:hypothetical protein